MQCWITPPISEKEMLLGLLTASLEEELGCPVTITVRGRPFSGVWVDENDYGDKSENTEEPLCRMEPFILRWNCVLDLTPQ
jgi:hypothetical protein